MLSPAAALLPITLGALGSLYPCPHLGRSYGYKMGIAGEYASSPGPCPSLSCHFCVHSPVSQLITSSASLSPRSSVDSFGHVLITHSCGCPFHGSAELRMEVKVLSPDGVNCQPGPASCGHWQGIGHGVTPALRYPLEMGTGLPGWSQEPSKVCSEGMAPLFAHLLAGVRECSGAL